VNGRGGLLGRQVELVVYDDGSIPARSVENYERLLADERVDLLFAPARTRTIEQVAPLTERAGRLLFVGHGSGHAMFQQGRKYLFLGWPGTDFDDPRSFFEWGSLLPPGRRPRRVALLQPDDRRPSYTADPLHGVNQHNVGIVQGARHFAEQFGVELAYEALYTDDSSTYDELFGNVKAAQPDMLLVTNYALQSGSRQLTSFMTALRSAGLHQAFVWLYRVPSESEAGIGDRTLDPFRVRHRVDELFEGVFTYDQWDARSPNPMAREFVNAFVKRNDYLPDNISAGVYVACQLLQQAVEGTKSCDDEQLRHYLLDNELDTIMGTYRFQENGVPIARMLLLQCIDGQLQVVYPREERTADATLPG
jgi:branched-chain amino acid transport system substrate-binding protein